jgi:putative ABC transport system permease protein
MMDYREVVRVALDSFATNRVRFLLTALGMVIGTASLILVTTIALTGKQYVLNQIQAIGANMIYAEYGGGSIFGRENRGELLTLDDMRAVQQQVSGVIAASPMVELNERIPAGGGRERDIVVLGVGPDYRIIRNLQVLAGRFFDETDAQSRAKVAIVTEQFAEQMFGSQQAAVGQTLKLGSLPFTVVGTFRERVETFGQSELREQTVVIPYTVSRYFTGVDTVKQLFFSAATAADVPQTTQEISRVLHSRHREGAVYRVQNLTELLAVADRSADALTLVLLLVAMVTLVVSGIGIMNIMFVTVKSRTREIGIRKAVGATRREIKLQFLTEAVFIALVGGTVGTIMGLALPYSVRFLTNYRIPISGLSALIAIGVSSLVGIAFGTVPAARAAELDPVESLHYE